MHPRPLTRRNGDKKLYSRLPEVEEQIKIALTLNSPDLLDRARIEYTVEGFLQEECLVYLIREYQLSEDEVMVSRLFEILMGRCAGFIYEKLVALEGRADEAYDEVILDLVENILDFNSDRGDYYQVRFWVGLERLTISEFSRQLIKKREEQQTIFIDDLGEDEENQKPLSEVPDKSITQEEISLCKEALGILKEPFREVYILKNYFGWPIESKDKSLETLSTFFNVTPRTIRNWMNDAEEALQKWGKGEMA